MATFKEMIKVAGSVEKAETMAIELIGTNGKQHLLDLQLLYSMQGKVSESLAVSLAAKREMPGNARVDFNLGWHAISGDLAEGFRLCNRGRVEELWGNLPLPTDKPVWNGEDISGKHVLFCCEAGLGDNIIFVRFAKELALKKGARVTVACDSGLMSVFSRIPEVSSVVRSEAAMGAYHDYWIPSMSIPVVLGTKYEDLNGKPYLEASQEYVERYSELIKNDKFKIGIRWLGLAGEDYEHRVFPRDLLFKSATLPGVQLYSLQKDSGIKETLPPHIIDMEQFLQTWEDTAGIIANLDLIITSCTSVAHMSAAMGKPTWVIIPLMMYFIWAYPGNKSPWYDSVTLFRQEKYGDWEEPFNNVSKKLQNVLNSH